MAVSMRVMRWRLTAAMPATSWSSSAGTNSAHCTGVPGAARRSMASTESPAFAARAAARLPAGPSPTTRTSGVAIMRRRPACR